MASMRWLAVAALVVATSASAEAPAAEPAAEEAKAPAKAAVVEEAAVKAAKPARAAKAELAVVGRWTTIDDETGKPKSVVRIFQKDGKVYGQIEKLFRAPEEDQNPLCVECRGELKDKPIIGMTILRDLEQDDDEWTDGTVLDPANGKTYDVTISVQEGGRKLKVRGYLGISLLGRTPYWVRAD